MRAIAAGILVVMSWAPSLLAQEQGRPPERIELRPQQPPPVLRGFDPVTTAKPTTLGIVTLVPPTERGEMIRVRIPIGEIVSKAFKANSAARRRREEETVRREVERELQRFKDRWGR